MGFEVGKPRPVKAGRRAGTPNKRIFQRVSEALLSKKKDPVGEILKIIEEKKNGEFVLTPAKRIDSWLELLSYCEAKPKAVEIEPDDFNPDDFTEADTGKLLALVKA